MDLIKASNLRVSAITASPIINSCSFYGHLVLLSPRKISSQVWTCPFHFLSKNSLILHAKKRNSDSEPVLEPTIVEEVSMDEEDDIIDEFEDETLVDDGDAYVDEEEYEDGDEVEYEDDNGELYVGDGGGGGGISLAGTWWDKKALAIAKEVVRSFDGDLQIYAFKTLVNSTIQVRIEKLTNKSGSPSMEDIEAFCTTYRAKLDAAELAKVVPEIISLEVSSPGVERIVRIPNDLDRFKDRPMYVKYVKDDGSNGPSAEADGIFQLLSFDMETECCSWCLADVRVNREKAGKGRPLNKKRREWRLSTPFNSLRLVRLHSDI